MNLKMALLLVVVASLSLTPVSGAEPVVAQSAPDACVAPAFKGEAEVEPTQAGDQRVIALANSVADTSDDGEGTYRLCLDGKRKLSGAAVCRWSEDRSMVRSIETADGRRKGQRLDVSISAPVSVWADPMAEMSVDIHVEGDRWSTSEPGSWDLDRSATDALRVTFHATRSGVPARTVEGTISFRCGESPRLDDRARTIGEMTFRTDDAPETTWRTSVFCDWADWDDGVRHVARISNETMPVRTGPGRYLVARMTMDAGAPIVARLVPYPYTERVGANLIDARHAFPIWTRADLSSGTVRSHGLVPESPDGEPSPDATTTRDMIMTWDCGEAPRWVPDVGWHPRARRAGLVTIHTPTTPPEGIVAAASCLANEDPDDDPPWDFDAAAAAFTLDGRKAILIAEANGFVALYLADPEGHYLGDLVWPGPERNDREWDAVEDGIVDMPMALIRSSLTTDESIPEAMSIRMNWDCGPALGPLG